jgi:hypothetical protein
MPFFVKLTSGGKPAWFNLDQVVSIKPNDGTGSILTFTGGNVADGAITQGVKESVEQILDLLPAEMHSKS